MPTERSLFKFGTLQHVAVASSFLTARSVETLIQMALPILPYLGNALLKRSGNALLRD